MKNKNRISGSKTENETTEFLRFITFEFFEKTCLAKFPLLLTDSPAEQTLQMLKIKKCLSTC